ncbi:MAG: D-Ala-D-Ala carboxypeptidase family metallohydrolase [Bacteroidales bacterium]|nr:D-Ala-D-Ala carboxypeptidase family metallohydrolase [Bacteroidales bacterium]
MKYFTFTELSNSATATRYGIDNTPTEAVKKNLAALTDMVLDPLREAFKKPIYVNSGYRCPALNAKVGGAKNSGHLYGYAADITGGDAFANRKLWELLVDLNLPFHKIIWERGSGVGAKWLHVAYTGNPAHIMLRTDNGKTYYNCDRNGKAI